MSSRLVIAGRGLNFILHGPLHRLFERPLVMAAGFSQSQQSKVDQSQNPNIFWDYMLAVTQCDFCDIQLLTKSALLDTEGNWLHSAWVSGGQAHWRLKGLEEYLAYHTFTKFCFRLLLLIVINISILGFPGGSSGKEPGCQCRRLKRCGFDPWVWKIPWRRAWQPTTVSLSGESHGQRSWWAIVQRVTKSQTRQKWRSMHHYINIV